MDNIRLFTAVPLKLTIRGLLQSMLPDWQHHLPFHRWTHPADWHITLHYLGDTPLSGLPNVVRSINDCASIEAPFRLSLSGLGSFGDPNRPSVLWVGLNKPIDPLRQLHQRLGDSLKTHAGFIPESRPYRPHVTLARKFTGDKRFSESLLHPMNEELRSQSASWIADEIVLYRSHLGQTPMYEVIERVPLAERQRFTHENCHDT